MNIKYVTSVSQTLFSLSVVKFLFNRLGFTLSSVLSSFVNVLNFMASLSLGQIFVKHKILGSIVFYFFLNYVMGFITSLIMMVVPDLTTKMDNIENEITSVKQMVNTIANPMIGYFLIMLLLQIFMAVVYFVISNYMLSKKLNLE